MNSLLPSCLPSPAPSPRDSSSGREPGGGEHGASGATLSQPLPSRFDWTQSAGGSQGAFLPCSSIVGGSSASSAWPPPLPGPSSGLFQIGGGGGAGGSAGGRGSVAPPLFQTLPGGAGGALFGAGLKSGDSSGLVLPRLGGAATSPGSSAAGGKPNSAAAVDGGACSSAAASVARCDGSVGGGGGLLGIAGCRPWGEGSSSEGGATSCSAFGACSAGLGLGLVGERKGPSAGIVNAPLPLGLGSPAGGEALVTPGGGHSVAEAVASGPPTSADWRCPCGGGDCTQSFCECVDKLEAALKAEGFFD